MSCGRDLRKSTHSSRPHAFGAIVRAGNMVLTVPAALLILSITPPPERAPVVMVDWSEVSDARVQACNIPNLGRGLFAELAIRGYAVVARPQPDHITLRVTEAPTGFVVEAVRGSKSHRRTVQLPSDCDETIELELVAAADAALSEFTEPAKPEEASDEPTLAPPVRSSTEAPTRTEQTRPTDDPSEGLWRLHVGTVLIVPRPDTALAGLRGQVRRTLLSDIEVGAAGELAAFFGADSPILRSFLGAQITYLALGSREESSFRIGAEVGLSTFNSPAYGYFFDGRLGLLLEGRIPTLGATLLLMPYLQLHRIEVQDQYTDNWFGLLTSISTSFDL